MINQDFQQLLDVQVEQTKNTLAGKAEEYASETDRLSNFKKAALLEDTTPSKALLGMMSKHTVSVYDMVLGGEAHSAAEWDEKIGDHINYLILLKATLTDEGLYVAAPPKRGRPRRA